MKLQINKYLLIAVLIFSISCTEKEDESFSFVQLCDTQLGFDSEGYENDVDKFKRAVAQINELNPDFVIVCGDLVNIPVDSTFSDFKKIAAGLKMPCYNAPGNHDVGNNPTDSTLTYYRKTIGKDYYEFHHKGYSFIVTNSQLWKGNSGNESDRHDLWFKQTLKNQSAKNYPVVVVGHYPLFSEKPEEEEGYFNFPSLKRQELLALFSRNNVVAYLSGHAHKLIINNYDNIQMVSGETLSRNFDNKPFGFRLWQVSPDTVMQNFVPLQTTLVHDGIIK
ncbi:MULTISPECIES: metallophosphoesterase [unclassified Carboxylicivirga]|uniref:metallophosphoesterase n=1 Tax=Carboxylicivirga TaxID=1628153 RepID=UPI003D3522BC